MNPERIILETHDPQALRPSLARLLEQLRQARTERDTTSAQLRQMTTRYRNEYQRRERLHNQLLMLSNWHRPKRRRRCNPEQMMLNFNEGN